jgi:hypothetical protein
MFFHFAYFFKKTKKGYSFILVEPSIDQNNCRNGLFFTLDGRQKPTETAHLSSPDFMVVIEAI